MASPSRNLLVLGDAAVHNILTNLTRPEILQFQQSLGTCLASYSLADERSYQPAPGIINRPEGQKVLFRPFTSPSAVGTKMVVDPAGRAEHQGAERRPALSGMLAMCDANGNPAGVINAKEVTGYRTSMCALMPFMWRKDVSNIVIFGAGLQALWHSRLALGLRGDEIKSITFVNRSLPRVEELVATLKEENAKSWKSEAKLACVDASSADYQDRLKTLVRDASVVFCTVPSKEPLFPASYIRDRVAAGGSRPYVSAIGSWQPDMIELDPELVKYTVEQNAAVDFAPRGISNALVGGKGVIIVDDRQSAQHDAGEVVRPGLVPEQTIELGDLLDRHSKGSMTSDVKNWMEEGLVIYKSVGIGLTDLISGEILLEFAKKKQLGTVVEGF